MNFLYSAGITENLSNKGVWKRLNEAVALRHRRRELGVYAWNFENLGRASETLATYRLNGVMGNMNTSFGNLPANLGADQLSLVRAAVRSDGRSVFAATPMPVRTATGPVQTGAPVGLFDVSTGLYLGGMRCHYNANQGADEYYPTLQAVPVSLRLVRAVGADGPVVSGVEVEIRTTERSVGEYDRLGAWSTPTLYYYKSGWPQQRWFLEGDLRYGQAVVIRNKQSATACASASRAQRLPSTCRWGGSVDGVPAPRAQGRRTSVAAVRHHDPQDDVDHELRSGEKAGEQEEQADGVRLPAEAFGQPRAHPCDHSFVLWPGQRVRHATNTPLISGLSHQGQA